MTETMRQLIAAAVGVVIFLVLFLPVQLVWWLALILAVIAFLAVAVIIDVKPPANLEFLWDAGMRRDRFKALLANLQTIADGLKKLSAEDGDPTMQPVFAEMAEDLYAVVRFCNEYPRGIRIVKTRIVDFADVPTVSTEYVRLWRHSRGTDTVIKLDAVRRRIIDTFRTRIRQMRDECLETNLEQLTRTADVAGELIDDKRRYER